MEITRHARGVVLILLTVVYLEGATANCHDEYVAIVQHGKICARAFLHSHKEESQSCKGLRFDVERPEIPSLPPMFKEAISSMVISPGCMVTVYDTENFSGSSRAFYAGKHTSLMDVTRWVGWWQGNWNDKIASLKCTCDIQQGVGIKTG